jgi:hypothetical protein
MLSDSFWGLWIKRLFIFQKTDTLRQKTKTKLLCFFNGFVRDNAVDDWRRLNTTSRLKTCFIYTYWQLLCCLHNRKPVFQLDEEKWNSFLISARHTGVLSTLSPEEPRNEHTYRLCMIHVTSTVI